MLLESSPNLIAITGPGVADCMDCPVTLPYLPKLKYLVVNNMMRCISQIGHEDNRTPLLDHVHIQLGHFPSSNHWVHLLSVQGARLTSVSLDIRLSQYTNTSSEYLSKFTKFCPNLSYLEICINDWSFFPRLELFPTVERFGIHVQACNTGVDTICKALATIQLAICQGHSAHEPRYIRTVRLFRKREERLEPSGRSHISSRGL